MANKAKDKPETTKKAEAKTEVVNSLKVEVTFPNIVDLKQAIATDNDGNLIIAIQFKARVDQFEVFRLVNLLKQPHTGLSATITSPQSAMDFRFDAKEGKVAILKAAVPAALPQGKTQEKPKAGKSSPKETAVVQVDQPEDLVKIHAVTFNHVEGEEKPFGVLIEYVNGSGEIKSAAGRGKDPTEAVISGVKNCGAVAQELSEPFEVRAALETLEPSGECYKLIRVIDVGSFDLDEKGAEPAKEGD